MYLFFDTETTGFPTFPASNFRNWPRLVQLAWILTDTQGKEVERHSHIVRPEGFTIPQRVTKIHGISTELAYNEGDPLDYVLREFLISLSYTDMLIAHNFDFDHGVIRAELLRNKIPDFLKGYQTYCTMTSKPIIDYCNILRGDKRKKWPKLTELYSLLFDTTLLHAHNALYDTEACVKCFFKLKNLGIIQ